MMPVAQSCPSTSTDPAIAKLRAGTKQVALPPGFQPIAAVRCQSSVRMVPGNGEWDFVDAQRADSGMPQLVAALRLPSETAAPNAQYACPAMLMALPPFALVDAKGKVISPLLPHTVCAFPLRKVMDAINALPWRTETEQRLNQTRTQAEIDTGCSSAYKYLFDHPVSSTPQPWNRVDQPATPHPTRVCIYAVRPPSPGDDIAVGSFTHGAKLTPSQQGTVESAFSHAGEKPAPACTTRATRFVSVEETGTLVELDGCKRIRWPNDFMSAAPDSLVQLLATVGNG